MKSIIHVQIFLFAIFLLSSCMSTADKHSQIIDNTFDVTVSNTSRFEIEIDSQKIMPGKSIRHNLPLHESALYDGWNVTFRIPISEKIFYIHSEKITIADKQDVLEIKNPKAISEIESYVLVKNDSASSIQITSTSNNYLPVLLKGQINAVVPSSDYYIPSGKIGVVKAKNTTSLFIKNDDGIQSVFKNKSLDSATVYTFSFDGKAVTMTDKRPLANILEPTCEYSFPESVSVCALLKNPVSGAMYFAGTETAHDVRGNAFLRGVAGKLPLDDEQAQAAGRFAPFEVKGDVQFFDAAFSDNGELFAVGQVAMDEPRGIIVHYAANGAAADFAAVEEAAALGAICHADNSSFFAGGIDYDGNIIILSVSCGTEIECRKIALIELSDEESADGIEMCYCAPGNCVLLAVNPGSAGGFSPSHLYRIPVGGGTAAEISLQGKIGAVSSIIMNQNDELFLTGESPVGAQTAACILAVRPGDSSCEIKFISKKSPSWISDAWFDGASGELVVCGMTTSGKKRVPFVCAFDTQDFHTIFEKIYTGLEFSGLNDAAFVLPCADWGFTVIMSALDADNSRLAPFKAVRVTSSGQISEHHKTIK